MPTTNPYPLHPNPSLSLWLSVDPLSDKYPGVSPYAYCADNPVRLVDVDGREVIVHGERNAVRDYFREVRKGARALGVRVSMNESGRLSAKYVGKGTPSENATLLLNAINDSRVHVNIFASYDDYIVPLSGKAIPMFGGTFKGNFIVAGNAYCLQQVNPIDLKKMDAYYKKAGQSSLHELTESYIGGRLALPLNFGDLRTGQNNMFYHLSHNGAIEQSGLIYNYYFNKKGDQCPKDEAISIGYQGEGVGKEQLFKDIYIKRKHNKSIPFDFSNFLSH